MKKLYFIIALFFSLTGSTHLMAQYCIPSYSTGCASGDTIDDFIMADAGINHIGSGCSTGGYGDFTADPTLLATVEAGESYSFSATHGFGGQWLKVWIDLDGNGSFEDPGELLFTSAEGGSSTTGSIAIPGDAESITTRMRVMGRWNAVPTDSCDPGGLWGETHDYTVEVIGGGGGGGDCDTVFTDTGGPDGNYGNSENIVWTFNPDDPGNEVIVATFTAFNVENNFDNLFVYDGPDTSSPLIATLTGTTIPGPITSTHATGALTFNFISDGSVNRAGWIADITCESVGGGGEECEIVYSGSGQDGLGTLNGGLILSNDFRIIPDQTMTVESVTLKILSDVTSVNVGFLANNGNAPGAVIMAPVNIVPTSQTFVGVTPFGSNIYEVLLDLPTSQVFEGGASGTNYWITVSTVVGTEGDNYWEFASSVQNGTYFYYSPDGGATWVDAGTVGFFVDGAMTLSGECEGGTEPEGCEWTVNVFDTGLGDEVSWELRDASNAVLLSGGPYGSNYNDTQTVISGNGPMTFYIEAMGSWNDNTPSYTVSNGTEIVASGTLLGGDDATYSDLECEEAEPEGCEWTVNVFDTGLGDEVSWELRDASNAVLLSGGPYGSNYNDTQTVISGNGPMTFYIEAMGSWNDNTPSYTVSNGTEIVASGTLLGGDDATYSDLECEEAGGGGGDCDSGDLTTIFSGGNQFAGNMFDVTAIGGEDILIEGFDINIDPGTATISVYTRPGTYVGFENSSAGWTLMGSEVVTSAGENMPTFLDIGGLTIPAGEVYGFYVTVTDYPATSMNYTNGDFVYTDDYLQINTGVGKANPDFTGSTFASRSWNGTIYYCAGEGSGGGGECEQSNPTNPVAVDNGYNIVPGSGFGVAADVVVPADEDFTLEQVTIRVLDASTVTSVNLNYYSDAAGLPGTLIGSQANITPTSSTFVGVAFGWNIYEVVLDITPFTFEGQSGSTTTYWVQPETPTFWEVSYASVVGSVVARLSAGVWTLDTENNAEAVYVFSGTCEPIGGGEECEQSNPTNPVAVDNGYNIVPGSGFGVAADVVVPADEDFTLEQVTIRVLDASTVTSVNLNYYSDAAGLPGTLIGSQANITPTSSTFVGVAFGWNIYEVVLDITPFTFEGQSGSTTTYWVQPETPTFWEVSYASVVGSVVARLSAGVWTLDTENNAEAVYVFSGTCEPTSGGPTGDCDTVFTDTGGPDGNYGNSENIVWTFNPDDPGNEVIVATFTEFDVENGWDNLHVYDGPDTSSPLIATLTGTTIPEPITSTHATGALTFNFISDVSVNRAGWVADITCETVGGPINNDDCDDAIALSCGDVVTGTTVGMNNSGGNTAPDVFYSYTGNGEVEFVTVSLCGSLYDTYLRVYSDCDLTTQIAFNDDFCGLQSQLTFESDGVSTYIIMVEGFGSGAGEYTLELTCAGIPGCGDQFTDTGGTTGNYGNSEDIIWTFTPNVSGDLVTVTFSEFDVETNWDNLYVYDGPDLSSPLIATLTGTTIPDPITSTHATGALTFNFISDGSVNRAGWVAEITCEPEPTNDDCEDAFAIACGDTVSGTTTGMNDSGGNPAPDVFYEYTGNGQPELVTISLCGSNYDTYLRVFTDCDLNDEVAYNDDYCGIQSQLAFMSDGTSTYIIMVEGFGSQSGDYTLEVTCEALPGCGDVFTDTGGPSGNYGANENLTWTFTPNAGEVATLTFNSFDVEAEWDALYVFDGPDANSPMIGSGNPATGSGFPAGGYYGNTIPGPFTSTHASGALTVVFMSDGSIQNSGWTADVTCGEIGIPDGEILGFVYYPNPVVNILNIQADTTIDRVEIYNVLGQTVLNQNIGATSAQLNVGDFASGVYLMKVTSEGNTGTYQVIRR